AFDPRAFCRDPIPHENTGQIVAGNGDQATAIMPSSGSWWIARANGVLPDTRAGQQLGAVNGRPPDFFDGASWHQATPAATGDPMAPVQESNVRLNNPVPAYPGVSYAFNVMDDTEVSRASAIRFVGFDNAANGNTSPLCNGERTALIDHYGFGPLDTTA